MWQRERLYLEPRAYIDALCADIDLAAQRVRVEVYILADDATGRRVLDALARAAARGVEVTLLVDGVGSPSWSRQQLRALDHLGVDARVHHPPPRPIGWFYDHWLPRLRQLPASLAHLNKRTHRKVVTVDGERAWIGSQNFGDDFLHWRESNCCVEGASVRALERSLLRVWQAGASASEPAPRPGPRVRAATAGLADIRTNTTHRGRRRHRAVLLAKIRSARRRVWLNTAYFVPTTRLILALLRAAHGGADVALIVPQAPDHPPLHWLGELYYRTLIRGGVKVYEYQATMMHAKSVIVDDWLCIGSTNLNHRSFYHDLEVDVVLHRPQSLQAMCRQFDLDRGNSQRVDELALSRRPWLTKLAGRLAHTVRNWL